MSDGNNWLNNTQGLTVLTQLHEALARVHRIQLLAKLARAKKQLEVARMLEEEARRGTR